MSGKPQRQLILHMSVSLDGFVAHTDGIIDWHASENPGSVDHGSRRHRANLELLGQVDTIVMGRGAYVDFEQGWSRSDNPMAVLMNSLPKDDPQCGPALGLAVVTVGHQQGPRTACTDDGTGARGADRDPRRPGR